MTDRDSRERSSYSGAGVGLSMINVLSNIAYAGMRAQGSKDSLARFFTFWVGFPGTLVSYFLVDEGSERAYGIDLPRKHHRSSTVDL